MTGNETAGKGGYGALSEVSRSAENATWPLGKGVIGIPLGKNDAQPWHPDG